MRVSIRLSLGVLGIACTGSMSAEAKSVMQQCSAEWQAAQANSAPIGRKSHPMEPMEWQAAQLNNPAGHTWQEFLKACRERLASH